jgi:hypothetical protein
MKVGRLLLKDGDACKSKIIILKKIHIAGLWLWI